MLGIILLLSLTGFAQAYWWPWKANSGGTYYDCTKRGFAQTGAAGWYYYPDPYAQTESSRQPCRFYTEYSYDWRSGYQYWDPYSYSYRTCRDYAYTSEFYGSLYCGPANTWWPFKWRDPQTGGWFDCHQWELRSDGTRRWYHSSGNTCSDYHGVNYAWNTRYWYWDLQDQRYYECLSYNYYKGGTPYPCGLPPPAGYNAPMGGYTGPQYTGGGY